MVYAPQSSQGSDFDQNARAYLDSLQAGIKPDIRPAFGRWEHVVRRAENGFALGTQVAKLLRNLSDDRKKYPGLAELLLVGSTNEPALLVPHCSTPEDSAPSYPPLLEIAQLDPNLAIGACPELDCYERFSKQASPEGWDDFHVFCGLWLFSTINARRSYLSMKSGKHIHGNLMIALCADSSMFAKSTTADVAKSILVECGFAWLLTPNRLTPQKLLSDMSGTYIPPNFSELSDERQASIEERMAMPGQKGMYYDEFGKFVQSMLRKQSIMADFADFFMEFDSCPALYENATITRGGEPIAKPSLSLLGSMTPANIRESAKAGSDFWTDGFWARFSFVAAPPATLETIKDCPLEAGEFQMPWGLIRRLQAWHERLGIPECRLVERIDEKTQKKTGKYDIDRQSLPETPCVLTSEAQTAWYHYRSALKRMSLSSGTRDLDANYARLSETAMRMAVLMASLSNQNVIDLRIWAKAQELAEILRKNLHALYAQVSIPEQPTTQTATIEDKIKVTVQKLCSQDKPPSVRDLCWALGARNNGKGIDSGTIKQAVANLERTHQLKKERIGKTERYSLNTEEED